jgi:hypothetical protein
MISRDGKNLPLATILETAERINKTEAHLTELYNSVNLVLKEIISVTDALDALRTDTLIQLVAFETEISYIKGILQKDSDKRSVINND